MALYDRKPEKLVGKCNRCSFVCLFSVYSKNATWLLTSMKTDGSTNSTYVKSATKSMLSVAHPGIDRNTSISKLVYWKDVGYSIDSKMFRLFSWLWAIVSISINLLKVRIFFDASPLHHHILQDFIINIIYPILHFHIFSYDQQLSLLFFGKFSLTALRRAGPRLLSQQAFQEGLRPGQQLRRAVRPCRAIVKIFWLRRFLAEKIF